MNDGLQRFGGANEECLERRDDLADLDRGVGRVDVRRRYALVPLIAVPGRAQHRWGRFSPTTAAS